MQFLSDAWIAALDRAAVASRPPVVPDTGGLVVQQVVTDGPDGEVTFHLDLSAGGLRVRLGRSDQPTVTLTETYDQAVRIAAGEQSAQAAFIAGRIRLGGDVTALVRHQGALAALDDVFAAVRAVTEYPRA